MGKREVAEALAAGLELGERVHGIEGAERPGAGGHGERRHAGAGGNPGCGVRPRRTGLRRSGPAIGRLGATCELTFVIVVCRDRLHRAGRRQRS